MKLYADAGMLKETYKRFSADKAPRLAAAARESMRTR